jgi:hypothetical protein
MAAAKLQYCDRLSEDIRTSMVNFLRENSHLMGEASMNFGGSAMQEHGGGNNINSRRASLISNLSPTRQSTGSSINSGGGLASTAALLQQFYQMELKEEDEDDARSANDDDDDDPNIKDEEMGEKGERIEENDTILASPTSEGIGNTQASSSQTTTASSGRRAEFAMQGNATPAIKSKATKLLGLSSTTAPHSARLLEMMEYADVQAVSSSTATNQLDNTTRLPMMGARASVLSPPPTGGGNTLERLTRVAYEVAIQKSEAPAPHERVLVVIVGVWLFLIATISLFNLSYEQRLTIIGISVNLNISFFYGAPLSTIFKVIKTRDSSSIHRYTMLLNTGCSVFFMLFGIGVQDKYMIVPNAIGVALGVAQAILRTVLPNRDNMFPEEDKALVAIRSVLSYLNSSINSIVPKQGDRKQPSTIIKDDEGRHDEESSEMESAKELDNYSISSTSISSADFLQYLYSSTLPKQLERKLSTKKNEYDTTIPIQIDRKPPQARVDSDGLVEDVVGIDGSGDHPNRYLYFTPSGKS